MQPKHNKNAKQSTISRNEGFTLIELLVVVAIILIIAGIAIPNLLRSRKAANEAAAVGNLRTITTASVVYNSTFNNGFPASLATLGRSGSSATCDSAFLIPNNLANTPSQQSGYGFTYAGVGGNAPLGAGCGSAGFNGYFAYAVPLYEGTTGERSFCSDTPGVIHVDLSGQAPADESACDALAVLQ